MHRLLGGARRVRPNGLREPLGVVNITSETELHPPVGWTCCWAARRRTKRKQRSAPAPTGEAAPLTTPARHSRSDVTFTPSPPTSRPTARMMHTLWRVDLHVFVSHFAWLDKSSKACSGTTRAVSTNLAATATSNLRNFKAVRIARMASFFFSNFSAIWARFAICTTSDPSTAIRPQIMSVVGVAYQALTTSLPPTSPAPVVKKPATVTGNNTNHWRIVLLCRFFRYRYPEKFCPCLAGVSRGQNLSGQLIGDYCSLHLL